MIDDLDAKACVRGPQRRCRWWHGTLKKENNMAHLILNHDKGFSKGAPWHIDETKSRWTVGDKTLTPTEAAKIGWARNDGEDGIWNPIRVRCLADAGDGETVAIPDSYHIARDDMPTNDSRRFLSAGRGVSSKYKVISNTDILDYANSLTNFGAHVDSCGSIMNGRRVFMSMYLPNGAEIAGEPTVNHFLLTGNNQGTACFEALTAPMLTVCYNTLTWNRRESKNRFKFRHTTNVTERMSECETIINIASANFADTKSIMENFALKKIDEQMAREFVEQINGSGSTKADNDNNRVLELFNGEQLGCDLPSRKGTLFGLVNAFSQFIETEATVQCHKAPDGTHWDQSEVRMNSVMFGRGARKRDKVMDTAFAMIS